MLCQILFIRWLSGSGLISKHIELLINFIESKPERFYLSENRLYVSKQSTDKHQEERYQLAEYHPFPGNCTWNHAKIAQVFYINMPGIEQRKTIWQAGEQDTKLGKARL